MAKFKVGDRVKSSGMRDVYVVKRVMRAGDFSFDSNLKAEAEKAYAKGDVGYEVHDEDDSDEVTYLFEKDDHLTLANSRACNAKFKIGDKVTDGNAVYEITDVDDGVYKWRPVGGKGDPSYSEGGEVEWAERMMRLANSAPVSANSVVRNAMAANARTARNAKYNHQFAPEVMRFLKAALDNLKKASSYVAFVEEMSPVASAIHSVEEAIRKLQ